MPKLKLTEETSVSAHLENCLLNYSATGNVTRSVDKATKILGWRVDCGFKWTGYRSVNDSGVLEDWFFWEGCHVIDIQDSEAGWQKRSGCRGTWNLCSCFGQDSSCHERMLCLGATFLNGSIISNCVKLPLPKGLPMAARALMLIGQIVFGFETQTVINETTVNEFGPRWFSPPCFSCWYRFHEVLPCIFGHCAWHGETGSMARMTVLNWMPSLRSVCLRPSFCGWGNWVLSKTTQGVDSRARLQLRTRVLFWKDI